MTKKLFAVGLSLIMFLPVISFGQQKKTIAPESSLLKFKEKVKIDLSKNWGAVNVEDLKAGSQIINGRSCGMIRGTIAVDGRKFQVNCWAGHQFNNAIKALADKSFWKPGAGDIATIYYRSPILPKERMIENTGGPDTHGQLLALDKNGKLVIVESREINNLRVDHNGLITQLERLRGEGEDFESENLWIREMAVPLTKEESARLTFFAEAVKNKGYAFFKLLKFPLLQEKLKYVYVDDEQSRRELGRICDYYICSELVIQGIMAFLEAKWDYLDPRTGDYVPIDARFVPKDWQTRQDGNGNPIFRPYLPNPKKWSPYDLRADTGGFLAKRWKKPREAIKCILPANGDRADVNYILLQGQKK